MGRPATNFTLMLHGEPGAGKTTLLLKFAKYLANTFGKVLYISSEEFAASTMTEKVNTLLNPFPANLEFAENLKDPQLSKYDFIILDSVNDLGLQLQDYKDLRAKYPNTAFILILQHTKAGKYRGGKDWEHEIEIGGEVVSGVITIYRNRYGVKGSMNFFTDTPVTNYSLPKPY
jgi:predicted ATP-dependent serine protease